MSSNLLQVLEEEEYHRRKGYYLDSLQRHYYFMNVGNGEVIDACRKVMPFLGAQSVWGNSTKLFPVPACQPLHMRCICCESHLPIVMPQWRVLTGLWLLFS